MSSPLVIFLILIIAAGAFFFGRWHGMSQRSKALSEELKAKEDELNALKQDVNAHFDETARLFSNVTEEYKILYQHLANGATKLGNRKFELKLSSNTSGLTGLSNPLSNDLEKSIIDSEAKEIADYDTGPQQPRDYADNDMDDDYHPSHTTDTVDTEQSSDEGLKADEQGNSSDKKHSESSSQNIEKEFTHGAAETGTSKTSKKEPSAQKEPSAKEPSTN